MKIKRRNGFSGKECGDPFYWPASSWPDLPDGTWTMSRHYYAAGVQKHWDLTPDSTLDVSVNAVTEEKLYTGGKAGINHLFGIHVDTADEWFKPPLDNDYEYPWWGTPGKAIDRTRLIVAGKHPGADGNVWVALPDNSEQDITVHAPGVKHFNAGTSPTKYKSHFYVFVCQPYPGFTYIGQQYGVPRPPGYPTWRLGVNAGHAWWGLSTEAPVDVVNQFANANASQWLDQQVGYGCTNLNWSLYHWSATGSGELPFPYGNPATVSGSYEIGFQSPGVIDGLNFTENLHENPGTYNLRNNNCVIKTVGAGSAVGVTLPTGPDDWKPEYFGAHLPPNN